MQIEAVIKALLVGVALVGTATSSVQADALSYVEYIRVNTSFDFRDVPWEIVSMVEAYDMRAPDEPIRCFITLDVVDWDFAGKYSEPPAGEFAVFNGIQWHFSGAFAAASETNSCGKEYLF